MMNIQRLLDPVGWQLVEALQENARLSYQELGQRVGLSPVAVAERIRRLEEAGVITGYRAEIDATAVGLPTLAFIRLTIPHEKWTRFAMAVREMNEVYECHRVLGEDSYILKVCVASVRRLEQLIDRLAAYGQPTTSLVVSSAIVRRSIEQTSVNNDGADDSGQPG
jgi:Lrp/AsnC family leucine-responsive transcriptional regulator